MNKYEKLAQIGRGAHGTVYLAQRISSDGYAAQKVIIKEIPIEGMTLVQRQNALGETKVLQMLSHPNIIGYYEYFIERNSLCIVMQYAEGGTMADFLLSRKGRPVEEHRVMQLFTQILLALHHVHSKSILHRDLKTQNILMNRSATVCKLSDFGISKELMTQSKADTVIGTPYYLSPEIVSGRSYNQKSDIWALGCILYEMITLRRAFEADTMPGLFDRISKTSPDPLGDHVSTELSSIVNWCLDRDPNRRPDTVQLLAHPLVLMSALNVCTDLGTLPCLKPAKEQTTPTSAKKLRTGNDKSTLSPLSILSVMAGYYRLCLINKQSLIELDIPSAETEIGQVVTNGNQHFAVTENGTLIEWTADESSVFEHSPSPTRLSHGLGLNVGTQYSSHYVRTSNVVTLAAGSTFYLLVNDQGMLLSAGYSEYGCLAQGDHVYKADTPQVVEKLMTAAVTRIACGASHVLALTDDNDLYAWGKTNNGRLGIEPTAPDDDTTEMASFISEPTLVHLTARAQIHSVYCSMDASAVLLADGTVWATGSNMFNKLCLNTASRSVSYVDTFTKCDLPAVNLQLPQPVSLGMNHTVIVSDQKVYLAGNPCGLTSVRTGNPQNARLLQELESRPRRVMAGNNITVIVTADQKIWKYVADESSQSGQLLAVELPDCDSKREIVSVDVKDQTILVAVKW